MLCRKSLRIVSCLALLLALPAADAQQPAPKKSAPRTDPYGDPLPESAIARLGSVRFHHEGGVSVAAFSADGKTILAAGFENAKMSLRFWQTATGKELSRLAISGANITRLTFAPDDKSIFVGFEREVEQYDRQTGKLLRIFGDPKGWSGSRGCALSTDGRMVATTSVNKDSEAVVHIWETATGLERSVLKGNRKGVDRCEFSKDGKQFMAASRATRIKDGPLEASIWVWDIASGKMLHEIKGEGYISAVAPDDLKALFMDDKWEAHVVDVVTGQTVCAFKARTSAMEFSPDSKAIISLDYDGHEPPCLWDATTGKLLRRFSPQHRDKLRLVGFSPDGNIVAATTRWDMDGSIVFWSVATGEPIHHTGGHLESVTSIVFSPNGKILASGSVDTTVRLWEPAKSTELACLRGHKAGVTAVAFAPNGELLASSSYDGDIRLWNTAKRSQVARLEGPTNGAACLAFSLDGKTLIAGGRSPEVRIWDVAALKMIGAFTTGHDGRIFAISAGTKLALSANGELRMENAVEALRLWKLPAGKVLESIDLRKSEKNRDNLVTWTAALAGDGRLLASSHSMASWTERGSVYADDTVRVWERATGEELHKMANTKIHAFAFSPSGRILAAGHGNTLTFLNHSRESHVSLWDMLTGEKIGDRKGHTNEVACVAFSPDGKMLASGSADHTILIWSDFQPALLKRHAKEPTVKELEAWWDDLKNAKSNAREAMTELVAYPEQTVKWIREHVKPAAAGDTDQIGRLIAELDSNNYKEREKANAALEAIGEIAEPQLRQVLEGKPTLEHRRRVELLLDKLENAPLVPEQLRFIRAVAALEWIGTIEAKDLLATFAKGAPGARLTQLAQTALQRVNH
ncbi:MAG TPA: WD40 repeat domain-containing protein [Gemmataceae bacterium]|nr:WD40 repeat domain-containing protein [Gemmataceae bacterium]